MFRVDTSIGLQGVHEKKEKGTLKGGAWSIYYQAILMLNKY